MGRQILMVMVLIQAAGIGVLAMASDRGGHGGVLGLQREPSSSTTTQAQDARPMDVAAHIKGTLSCPQSEKNTGRACQLQIKSDVNGRVYDIASGSNAMNLYQDGRRHVAIEGHTDGDTLQVDQVSPL